MMTRHARVHLTGGSLRVFGRFSWLEVGSVKMALPRPAHQQVTQTVSPPAVSRFSVYVFVRVDKNYHVFFFRY